MRASRSPLSPYPSLTAGCGEGTEGGWAAAARVPDANGAISGAGGETLGGGTEGQAPHSIPVALQDVAQHAWVWIHRGGGDGLRQGRQPHRGQPGAQAVLHSPSLTPTSARPSNLSLPPHTLGAAHILLIWEDFRALKAAQHGSSRG